MKKITFKIFFVCVLFSSFISTGQCLTSVNGLYPAGTFTPTCSTVDPNVITTVAYAGEYSNVNVVAGETYTFASSNPTDYITISTDDGATATAYGITPITWTSDLDGVIRYYIHLDDLCGEADVSRTRTIACGTPPCVQPQVTFSKTFDCGSSTFEVIADITDLGSASTITVTDDQSSSPQSISSAGPVTFGPYAFGTSVVLTATNDDTPVCNVVSPVQVFVSCPPSNDECDGAEPLTINADGSCTIVTSSTIAGATASSADAASCFGSEDDDVWFSFVAESQSQTITLSNVVGSTTDLFHSLWTGDCGSLTLVPGTCSDPNFSAPTGLVVGQTYYLRVYSYTATVGQTTTFDICIGTPPAPPANDECDAAIALDVNADASCAIFTSATTQSATASAVDAAGCGGTEDDDVWFSFVATDALQSISLINVAGSTTDLFHSLWTGDCAALTLVPGSCSDANASTPTGLTAGQTYYLRVYTSTATTGQTTTFDVCIGTPPPPPANDDCTGAIELTAGGLFDTSPVTGSTVSATTTVGLPVFSCQTNRVNDVWYSVVVPDSGSITIETQAASGSLMTDSVISIYSGTCGSLVEVGCDDDSSPGTDFFSLKSLTGLTPGSTIYVGVWRYSLGAGVDGEFRLAAYDASLLGNSAFESNGFKSYPNPVKNVLNLSYDKNISSVAVFNLLGQEVLTKAINANQSQIDMSGVTAGTYLVKVTADDQVKTIKVIKE
ncbi:MAG: T9SS type A sorting domain-containing protein [Flavobacterium sp.]|nr:T9SS type A sorting domain-containing protein [Flavobacterium sp.]